MYVSILTSRMFVLVQETTPLAGSSAGAIVCAVIASGESMEEALHATKILAEDCRNRGTAFRLGVVVYSVIEINNSVFASGVIFSIQ